MIFLKKEPAGYSVGFFRGQTEEWYLEKIIYDIQRDRRG